MNDARHERWRRPSCRGVTLIELLVVMFIAAVLMTIAAPAFSGIGRGSALRAATSSVRSTLALSRQWAIIHKETVSFSYAPAGGGINATFWVTNQLGERIGTTVTNPPTIDFQAAGSVTFKPDGSLNPITTHSIVLMGSNAVSRTIRVRGLTGSVEVN